MRLQLAIAMIATSLVSVKAQLPHYNWGFPLGANGPQESNTITKDKTGDIIISGRFYNTVDFDGTAGVSTMTPSANGDMFLVKYKSDTSLLWSLKIGVAGSFDDTGFEVKTDSLNNIIVGGYFHGTSVDFNPLGAPYLLAGTGVSTQIGYLAKYTPTGILEWAFEIGDSPSNHVEQIEITKDQGIVCAGGFNGSYDFDPLGGSNLFLNTSFNYNAFLVKYDKNGHSQWGFAFGSNSSSSKIFGISSDDSSNIYVAGSFVDSINVDPLATNQWIHALSGKSQFIAKYTPNGILEWVRVIGKTTGTFPSIPDIAYGNQNVYVCGYFEGVFDSDPGPNMSNLTATGGNDAHFMIKLSANQGLYQNSFVVQKASTGGVKTMVNWDETSNWITMAGHFWGTTDIDPGPGMFNVTNHSGSNDMWFAGFDQDLNFKWGMSVGGAGKEVFGDFVLADTNKLYVSGAFWDNFDMDPTTNNVFIHSQHLGDAYLVKYTIPCEIMIIDSVSVCSGDSAIVFNNYESQQGWYYDTTVGSPCDTVRSIYLNVSNIIGFDTISICNNDSVLISGVYYNQAGVYFDTLTSSFSCDSIVEIILEVDSVDTGVSESGGVIACDLVGAQYQWFDCNTSSIITDETSEIYTPSVSGNYSAIITEGQCTDTSDCIEVIISFGNLPEISLITNLFPNPSRDNLTIQFGETFSGIIKIYSVSGSLVYEAALRNVGEVSCYVKDWTKGTYTVHIYNNSQLRWIERIIVQ